MTLTKEWLQQTISELEEERDAIPGAVNEDAAMALAAMKLALASLEAEPVGFVARHKETGKFGSYLHPKADWFKNDQYEILKAYTAPPAPVVPDEWRMMCGEWRDEKVSIHDDSGLIVSGVDTNVAGVIVEAHNACRAAMLQGADGNSPAIPDWQAEAEKMAELHGSSFVVFRNGESPKCADSSKVIISFTDEGLGHGAAAPQQEVKS